MPINYKKNNLINHHLQNQKANDFDTSYGVSGTQVNVDHGQTLESFTTRSTSVPLDFV